MIFKYLNNFLWQWGITIFEEMKIKHENKTIRMKIDVKKIQKKQMNTIIYFWQVYVLF